MFSRERCIRDNLRNKKEEINILANEPPLYHVTLAKYSHNAFQTIFSFFQLLFFNRKRHFYPFFAAFHFLRTDFIDSGGVKKTNTEKYTFLRCDFYCPQKSMT